jgi:hypothetical protein
MISMLLINGNSPRMKKVHDQHETMFLLPHSLSIMRIHCKLRDLGLWPPFPSSGRQPSKVYLMRMHPTARGCRCRVLRLVKTYAWLIPVLEPQQQHGTGLGRSGSLPISDTASFADSGFRILERLKSSEESGVHFATSRPHPLVVIAMPF